MAAHLQQRQHQRGEFMAHRDTSESHADIGAHPPNQEGRLAGVLTVAIEAHLVGQGSDVFEQTCKLRRLRAVVQRRDQFDRLGDVGQIAFQLILHCGVEHYIPPERRETGAKKPPMLPFSGKPFAWAKLGGCGAATPSWHRRTTVSGIRSCRPGPAREQGSFHPLPTWPGRLHRGATRHIARPSPCGAVPKRCGQRLRW